MRDKTSKQQHRMAQLWTCWRRLVAMPTSSWTGTFTDQNCDQIRAFRAGPNRGSSCSPGSSRRSARQVMLRQMEGQIENQGVTGVVRDRTAVPRNRSIGESSLERHEGDHGASVQQTWSSSRKSPRIPRTVAQQLARSQCRVAEVQNGREVESANPRDRSMAKRYV